MALGGNPNASGKPKTKLGGGGGTEYKGLQANAGGTYGQAPIGGNNVTNEKGPGLGSDKMIGYGAGAATGPGVQDATLAQSALILQQLAQMYASYQPPDMTNTAAAKEQLRMAQMESRKPLNQGAFYVGY
jgi:hypothetical protein